MAEKEPSSDLSVQHLNYTFPSTGATGLNDVTLSLPAGSRTLLVGANGAGKTTLLRLLAGKRMAPAGTVRVGGLDPFGDNLTGVTYLGTEWVLNAIVRTDMGVRELLASVGGHTPSLKSRREELVNLLDVDESWRMHAVSDGERRRVQLAMGLLSPFRVLLLDEVTVDLDLLTRANFLEWLRHETETRACAVVYATHILDNLARWPTHLVHMSLGRVKKWGALEEFVGPEEMERDPEARRSGNSALGEVVLRWLKEDLAERGPRKGAAWTAEMVERDRGVVAGYGQEKRPG